MLRILLPKIWWKELTVQASVTTLFSNSLAMFAALVPPPFKIAYTISNKQENFHILLSCALHGVLKMYSKPFLHACCLLCQAVTLIITPNILLNTSMFCFQLLYECQSIPLQVTFLFKNNSMHCCFNHQELKASGTGHLSFWHSVS